MTTFTCAYRPLSFCHNYRRLDVTIVPLRNDNYMAIELSHWPFLSVKRLQCSGRWISLGSVARKCSCIHIHTHPRISIHICMHQCLDVELWTFPLATSVFIEIIFILCWIISIYIKFDKVNCLASQNDSNEVETHRCYIEIQSFQYSFLYTVVMLFIALMY